SDVSLDIPAKDKAPPLPAPIPSKTPAKSDAAAPPAVVPANAGAQEATPPAPKSEGPAKPAPKAAPEKSAPATNAAAEPKLEGFAVQVGAFKDEAKLTAAREKLMEAKIPHFVERRGGLNRLRAGPYSTREAAEKALASIK